ncbi:hypothetical protein SLS56_001875 [Neofusicoccum ribis]|uniref:Flavin reductase like domain-containing protein n=1 Tax=Neofusicoccum ribis TaxID=45134 RepID=A0ABR3T6B9_9PEZI
MFYEPGKTDHGLPHDPFKACVVPRPIGWISSVSAAGTHNLAPYSQFNNLTFDPPYVMFSANQTPSDRRKDTVANVEATGRFAWNLATWDLRDAVNASAEQVPPDVDEFERAGLEKEFTTVLAEPRVPMVKASPVRFECVYHSTLRLPGNPPMGTVDVVIGRVVAVHIADEVLTDGILDVRKTQPIARCGYYQYAVVRETFDMIIPSGGQWGEDILSGLEGSSRKNKEIGQREKKEDGAEAKS